MSNRFEQGPILEKVWDALESLYQARTGPVHVAASRVGMSQSGLTRAIFEKRDLHLSNVERYANAFGYVVQIHFIPLDEVGENFEYAVVHPKHES